MKLTKIVPKRTKTIEFRWIQKDFMEMSQKYRDIRSQCKSRLDKCDWCNHEFVDGEMMSLGQPLIGRNMMLCKSCCSEAQ